MDPITGQVWNTVNDPGGEPGGLVVKMNPDASIAGTYGHGAHAAQGMAVDGSGNVWVTRSQYPGTRTVGHLLTDGTFVGNVALPGDGPTGVSVDMNGKVWVTNVNSDNVVRIDPDAGDTGAGGTRVGAVDLTVPLPAGTQPYGYGGMTSTVIADAIAPEGSWTVVQDGGAAGAPWGRVTWNTERQGALPAGTGIAVRVRAADTLAALPAAAWLPVRDGVPFARTGRYLEVRASLTASITGVGPVLSDLRIQPSWPPACTAARPSTARLWPADETFRTVQIRGVTEPGGGTATVRITGIRQDEPVNSTGTRYAPDGAGVGSAAARLRAERTGPGNGRVYHVAFSATGAAGSCTGEVTVQVPATRTGTAVDDGPAYDSTGY